MRKAVLCMCCLGLAASVALAGGELLQTAEAAKAVTPLRIGQLLSDGSVGEWLDYGTRQDCEFVEVFDAFDQDGTGAPCCADTGCGMSAPSSRWYFGETYCNGYYTNDMGFDPGPDFAERVEFAWFWYVTGPGSSENCTIIVEFFDGFDDTCQYGDGFDENGNPTNWLGGVIFDFGPLDSGSGAGYYYTDVDLCGLDWLEFDADGAMAYQVWILTYDDAYPDDPYIATCGQPMLWGPTNPISMGPGTMGPIQWDDDDPVDGSHDVPLECYDYTFGICPDPLGGMALFFDAIDVEPPCGGADIDGDGVVGHSDLGILLSQWGTAGPDGDIDGDGVVGHSDLGILLGNWGCTWP